MAFAEKALKVASAAAAKAHRPNGRKLVHQQSSTNI
jgi:hypothetical protein